VLTPAETQALERRAADLTASGTPVVVYLRAQDASQTQTRNDASHFMDAWNALREVRLEDHHAKDVCPASQLTGELAHASSQQVQPFSAFSGTPN
jgi:hypothetical protein